MLFRKAAIAVAALALPAAALVAPTAAQAAEAPYKDPVVKSIGGVRYKGNRATVRAAYKCYGGNQGTHIWVSLKQGPKIAAMTIAELNMSHGTSEIANAWYDTNLTDLQEVYVVCNGHTQHQTFKLTRHPDKAKLTGKDKRKTFLQFCLFDSHSDPNNQNPQPDDPGFAFKYKFVNVKHAKRLHFDYDQA
jgi:hypothetical protein